MPRAGGPAIFDVVTKLRHSPWLVGSAKVRRQKLMESPLKRTKAGTGPAFVIRE
jgi:hypothetical protein